jgi:hypothetical protein
MGRFNEIYRIKTEIKDMLFGDQNLLKLLYYNSALPLTELRIKNPYLLLNDCIFFKPKNYTALDQQKSMLFVNFRFSSKGDYSVLGDVIIIFDLIVHNDLIEITVDSNTKDRQIEILDKIDDFINGKFICIGKATPYSADPILTGDDYVGYRLTYKILGKNFNFNNKN